jgi:multidrug efflux pump subunit AcrA (membrane-fusion protein)
LPAVVGLVNDKIDPETRTFRVRVGIDNSAGILKPGTFAEVALTVDSAPNAVVVPVAAVTYAGGEPAVFVLEGDRVRRRPVSLGIVSRDRKDPSRDRYEVLAGLSPGERVVVGGATAILADGMAVRLKGDAPKESNPVTP